MGFFSAVASFASSAFSAVCSVGRAVCSAVSGFASTLSSVAGSLGSIIGGGLKDLSIILSEVPLNEMIGEIIGVIADIVHDICVNLGIIEKEETPEEIGMKAQEAEKKPDDFDSIEEYINYLRDDIKLDKEKFENLTDEERLSCSAIGSTILAKGISEKKGIDLSSEFLVEVAKHKMKGEEVEAFIDNFKKNDLKMDSMKEYLRCDLSPEENEKVDVVVKETLKDINPQMSDEELDEKLEEMSEISLKDFE